MITLKKLKIKIKTSLGEYLVKWSVILHWPILTALIFVLIAGRLNKKGQFTVLCLGRSVFYDDLAALMKFSGQLKYCSIHLTYWQIIFDYFMNRCPNADKVSESSYHAQDFCQKEKQAYYQYLKKMFPILRHYLGFAAVLTGNLGYLVQQELARICLEQNIPFIVLHKEAIVVSDTYNEFLKIYQNHHFVGTKILFYNQQCLEGFLQLNLPGLTPAQAQLVGIPRFDNYFIAGEKIKAAGRPQLVFFTFLPQLAFRFLTKDNEKLARIEKRTFEFYRLMMEFAGRHPDFLVILKTKNADFFYQYPKDILAKYFPAGLINLKITNADDPLLLIKDSLAVVAFNSMVLIEAIIAEKPIIMPDFSDIMADQPWSFFQRHPQLVRYCRTLAELEKFIFSLNQNFSYNQKVKSDFLKEFISTDHGGASQTTEKAIIQTIANL
jgi:hypothetical protein